MTESLDVSSKVRAPVNSGVARQVSSGDIHMRDAASVGPMDGKSTLCVLYAVEISPSRRSLFRALIQKGLHTLKPCVAGGAFDKGRFHLKDKPH